LRYISRSLACCSASSRAKIEAAAETAEIPERSLIAAADVLGVRTQKGQWWLPS
jgi:LmbE family N-acetylglucosaminyl deacetylase